MALFQRSIDIPCSREDLYAWHCRDGAFERLQPPWETAEVIDRDHGIRDGSRVVVRVRVGPFSSVWRMVHQNVTPGVQFEDRMEGGPFSHWVHTHAFSSQGEHSARLTDSIAYRLPMGWLGSRIARGFTEKKLERMFAYRQETLHGDINAISANKGSSSMNILVSGATGLLGSELIPLLTTTGHRATRLTRSNAGQGETDIVWDPAAGKLNARLLEGFDAVIHLAGENIASGRWTADRKRRIEESRAAGTRLLAEALARLERKPNVLVSASAIGFYGERGDDAVNESDNAGSGFLPDVCKAWEDATAAAASAGIRVVNARIGIVLTPKGGALGKMLLPFRLGIGGKLGGGKQFMSWIAIDDVIGALLHAVTTGSVRGPMNVVAPDAVRNEEFTKLLGKVLGRPALFPAPAAILRIVLGELADSLLLASTRVKPTVLLESSYRYRYPDLEAALRHLLGR